MKSSSEEDAVTLCVKVKNTFLEYERDADVKSEVLTKRRSSSAPPHADAASKEHGSSHEQTDKNDGIDTREQMFACQSFTSSNSFVGQSFMSSTSATSAASAASFSFPSGGCGSSFENATESPESCPKSVAKQPAQLTLASESGEDAALMPSCSSGSAQASDQSNPRAACDDLPNWSSGLLEWMRPKKQKSRQSLITMARQAQQRKQRQHNLEILQNPQQPSMPEIVSPYLPLMPAAAVPEEQLAAASAAVQSRLTAQAHATGIDAVHPQDNRPNFCTSCGGAILTASKFCHFCGTSIASMRDS